MTRAEALRAEIVSRAVSWARSMRHEPKPPDCRCGRCALIEACLELDASVEGTTTEEQ